MATFHVIQSSFASGVLDPRLAARVDVEHYYQGVEIGENVLSAPQGGMKRRPGQQFTGTALGDGVDVPFSFSTTQNYLLVFSALRIEFYKDDVLVTNINGSGNAHLVTTYTLAELAEAEFFQSADTLFIFHENHAPATMIRGATDADWTLADITFSNISQFDFNDASSPPPTSEVQDVTFTTFVTGEPFRLEIGNSETPDIFYTTVNADLAARIAKEIQKLPETGETGVTCVFQAGTTFRITLAGEAADDYELVTGFSTDSAAGLITSAAVADGVPRREDAWSSARGYPWTGTLFEGRLYMGGTTQLPGALFGSRTNVLFDFEIGEGLDDDAIFIIISTKQVNAIRHLEPGRHLQIFTTGGEFYMPDSPITPGASAIPKQTRFGSNNTAPVEIDGSTLYVNRHGKTIREYTFDFGEDAYKSPSVSLLAAHLFENIVALDAQPGRTDSDANYIYALNGSGSALDGKMAVLNSLREQDLTAWTQWVSPGGTGKIKSVAVLDEDVYFRVERIIDGSTVYLIEKALQTHFMDASKTVTLGTAGKTFTGFQHLANTLVKVRADSAMVPDVTVSASGDIVLAENATSIEAGFEFVPKFKLMPLNVDIGDGVVIGREKRVVWVDLWVNETLGLTVNGEQVPDFVLGLDQFGVPSAPRTGVFRFKPDTKFDKFGQIEISQAVPAPMNVLAITEKVEVN